VIAPLGARRSLKKGEKKTAYLTETLLNAVEQLPNLHRQQAEMGQDNQQRMR